VTTSTRSGRIEEIFLLAIEQEPAAWRALLDRECGNDKELRAEVESLLKNHADSDDFMDSKHAPGKGLLTRIGAGADAISEDGFTLPQDRMIGRYRVIDRVGVGGMGVVFRAEQDRPKRTVALKVLRTGHTSPRMLRRFEFEADVLGRLQHPGIAQVYEAGVWADDGVSRPFIAMEFVRGETIARHCERKQLSVRDRLALMAKVCDAVQHAHQSGVIHRDLKPGNILVGEDGEPKLLDFGVACPLTNDLQLTTSMTGLGALIGTLSYMSPEQVSGDPNLIDTRSDVYALGVILYELLARRLPHDIKSRSLPEAARIIRDESPQRLSGFDRTLRGEIETIVGQALEKDRTQRYQSAASLAEDLRRYLSGAPILARNASRWYVLRKTVRRHAGWAAAAAAVVLGLVAFAVYATLQVQHERNQRIALGTALGEADTQRALARDANTKLRESNDKLNSVNEQLSGANNELNLSKRRLEAELRVSTIENARLSSRTGDLASAEKALWREHLKTPDSLHTQWALWETYFQHGMIASARAHATSIWAAALSLDGSLYATMSDDRIVRLWRSRDLSPTGEFTSGHVPGQRAASLLFSPDAALLYSGARDGKVITHRVATGDRVASIDLPGPARRLTLSSDGRTLVAAYEPQGKTGPIAGEAVVYTLPSWSERSRLSIPRGVFAVEFSHDDSLIYLGSDDGSVHAFTPDGLRVFGPGMTQDPVSHGLLGVKTLAVNPIRGTIFSAGRDRFIRTSDGRTGVTGPFVPTANGQVLGMRVTPDGTTLVSAGWWKVDLHDAATLQLRRSFTSPTSTQTLDLAGEGRYAIVGLSDGQARVWQIGPGAGKITLPGVEGRVTAAFSDDGATLLSGDSTGKVRLWSMPTLAHLHSWNAHAARVKTVLSVQFHDGSRRIITTGDDGFLRIWDADTRVLVREEGNVLDESCAAAAVSPDGRMLAFVRPGSQGTLVVVDPVTWTPLATLPKDPGGYAYIATRFSRDGKSLYASNRSRRVYAWSTADFASSPKQTVPENISWWSFAGTSDASKVVVSSWTRHIEVLDAQTFKPRGRLDGHTSLVSSVDVCPTDDRLLASTGADGTLRLWDLNEMRNIMMLQLGDANVEGLTVRFAPDGRSLVVAASFGVCFVIDLDYYRRAIANTVPFVLGSPEFDDLRSSPGADLVRAWAKEITERPWPRLGPDAAGR
jgi:WD40 repeat protein